ncbi:MAG: alpha/beta fold hydrolase [Chloroflexota bacterium]
MSDHPIDAPEILNNLFFVRKTILPNDGEYLKNGRIVVEESENGDIALGYRLHVHHSSAPLLLYFHGNGEIATDYDGAAPFYHACGVSLMIVDYRGYGWSTGTPLASKMLPDAQVILDKLDSVLGEQGIVPGRPLFVMGRSLGSAPAIYLALKNPDRLRGLIIESGYADAPSLFRRLGIPIPDDLADDDSLPINNGEKMRRVSTPTLVIHGERDVLIPVSHGKTLHENASNADKSLVIIPNAGHNNVGFTDIQKYFDAIKRFVDAHL